MKMDLDQLSHQAPDCLPMACPIVFLPPNHRDAAVNAKTIRSYKMAINPRHILDFIQHFVRRNYEKHSGLEEEQLHKGTSAEDNIQAVFEVFSRLGEDFMRHLKKALHTAGVEREELYLRLNNYLIQAP